MKLSLISASLLLLSFSVGAAPQMCFDQAGHDYKIDPLLLMSISIKESRLKPKRSTVLTGMERKMFVGCR